MEMGARPPFFGLVFWVDVAAVVAIGMGPRLGWELVPFGLTLAVLVVLWRRLPWDSAIMGGRRLLPPLFLLTAFAAAALDGYGVASPILLIALANVTLMYGVTTGAVLSAAAAGVMAGSMILLYDATWFDVLRQCGVTALMAGFVLAVSAAVLEARNQRRKAEGLLRELRRHSQRASENAVTQERARMARDMHDSLGHHLTVIKIGLENAERFRHLRPEAAWQEVGQAKELIQQAYAEARRWVRALRPLALENGAGGAALRELALSFDGTGIDVRFEVKGRERPLERASELVLYRALQEGLTNALRHAGASQVWTVLDFDAEWVALTVGDDGKGASEAALARGFGLSALAERAQDVGGTFAVHGAEGRGLTLRVQVP